ncbi:MAG TPA: hypothetical protein VFI46_01815 [Jiangellaceae bacterium]|nr:hypothetical protein [Jiangellaceae bacterium]
MVDSLGRIGQCREAMDSTTYWASLPTPGKNPDDIAYRKQAIDTALAAMGDFAKLVYPYLVARRGELALEIRPCPVSVHSKITLGDVLEGDSVSERL